MTRRPGSAFPLLAVLPLLPLAVAPADARAQADPAADAVRLEARGPGTPVAAGDRVAVRVRLVHRGGFHTWPHEPVVPPALEGVEPVPTELAGARGTRILSGVEVRWPAPDTVTARYGGPPVSLPAYRDTVEARLRGRVPAGAPPGVRRLELIVRFQPCDERVCYRPRTAAATVELEVTGGR